MKYSIRVRARLVRRLIWVEELLCSNHNNPNMITSYLSFYELKYMYIVIYYNDVDDMDRIIFLLKFSNK